MKTDKSQRKNGAGRLFCVALPIGNSGDFTKRAREVLNSVDVVAAEDTRTFGRMAESLGVTPRKIISHHLHNESASTDGILALLRKGFSVALVSDAGTPNLSDPGARLLESVFEEGFSVVPVPGASSLTTALSVCPLVGTDFLFLGFLPAKSGERKKRLKSARASLSPIVFFESPHRLSETLIDLQAEFENPKVFIARELTKTYEDIFFGSLTSAIQTFDEASIKGEFVVIVQRPETERISTDDVTSRVQLAFKKGQSARDILETLTLDPTVRSAFTKKELFNLIQKIRNDL